MVAGAVCAGAGAGPSESARSELGDLWRERDAIYLRADGRLTRQPGIVPVAARQAEVRVSAMARGREWPGRWTLVECEVRGDPGEVIRVGWSGTSEGTWREVVLGGGREERIRLPIEVSEPRDVVLRSSGGLRGRLEVGRVWLVDDRRVVWPREGEEGEARGLGEWRVERAGGRWRLGATEFPGEWEVVEVNAVRALLSGVSGQGAAVYASGRVVRIPATDAGEPQPRWTVRIDEDLGRLVRTTPGDVDGTGFDAQRGVAVIRTNARPPEGGSRRLVFHVEPVGVGRVSRPAVEVQGLAAGPVRVLWEGALVRSVARLGDGTILIEIPGEVGLEGSGGRVEILVQ